ncbi:MAG TPA: hypothetical protein DCZ55_04055 [Cyanobacteria bacterium UBA11371]|nr:hypothetical protein [Cyanobacteria bacterium UBA11371]
MNQKVTVSKLPAITLYFWIMKICATTLGETAGDLFSMTLNIGYATSSIILIGLFLISLVSQLWSKKYNPLLYWTVILSTSTAGTTMSDFMDRTLGLGYAKGSFMLLSILIAILAFWRFRIGSLSVNNVKTFKVELLYWTAILVSNTLGTALGDFLADSSGLGFAGGALLISALLGLVIIANFYTPISQVLLFWIAFVLTRPLGATVGDFLTKTHEKGGLGFGTIGSSLVLATILVFFILLTMRKKSVAQS